MAYLPMSLASKQEKFPLTTLPSFYVYLPLPIPTRRTQTFRGVTKSDEFYDIMVLPNVYLVTIIK